MNLRRFPDLRDAIAEFFNMEELRILIYDMGIDYDKIPGMEILGKSQFLIDYCERRGLTNGLLKALADARTNVNWQNKAQPKEEPIPKALAQSIQAPNFKKTTQAIIKDCGNMENTLDNQTNNIPTNLYRCYEFWESLSHDIKFLREVLSSALIEDINTIKESRSFLNLVVSYCRKLKQTLQRERINPLGMRPNSHVCDDLQTIEWHSEQVLNSIERLEGKLYADEDIDTEKYSVREEIPIIDSMITDVSNWLLTIIQVLNASEEPQNSDSTKSS